MMNDPEIIISKDDRTRGGSLPGAEQTKVTEILLSGGFILLPSDTCYSIAALIPQSETERRRINTLLGRPDIEISLAFPSILSTRQWIAQHAVVEALLKKYCPGPITVICAALHEELVLPSRFIMRSINVPDRTIGVRIPDSIIERDVAACTEFPITTVAVRTTGYKDPIQDFAAALDIVRSGVTDIGPARWGAIEGADFYVQNSTIVRIPGDGQVVDLVREGDISFSEIQAYLAETWSSTDSAR
jgi:L-threonylcarbamoyladenylate synthase